LRNRSQRRDGVTGAKRDEERVVLPLGGFEPALAILTRLEVRSQPGDLPAGKVADGEGFEFFLARTLRVWHTRPFRLHDRVELIEPMIS
jgi:hypothetical protein